MDYELDIEIDADALDVEWLDQPRLMLKYTRYEAEMEMKLAKEEERLNLLKAELDKQIREDPENFDIKTKVTEAVITNTILANKDYKIAFSKFLDIRFEYKISKNVIRSLEHKKTSLENLVKLHGQQYFAGPSVLRDLSKEWQQKQKQKDIDSRVGQKIKRTRG